MSEKLKRLSRKYHYEFVEEIKEGKVWIVRKNKKEYIIKYMDNKEEFDKELYYTKLLSADNISLGLNFYNKKDSIMVIEKLNDENNKLLQDEVITDDFIDLLESKISP